MPAVRERQQFGLRYLPGGFFRGLERDLRIVFETVDNKCRDGNIRKGIFVIPAFFVGPFRYIV